MDIDQYLEVFLDESREHLQAINDNLLLLEKQPQDHSIVEEIFRSAHTLKGMAATMGYEDISSLTHKMENVLDLIRKDRLTVSSEVIDITFLCVEAMEEMTESISEGGTGKKDVTQLVNQLMQIEKGEGTSVTEDVAVEQESSDVSMEIDEYQATVIRQAKDQGYRAFQTTVYINDDCMLKKARVFMVFDALEKLGEVIKSVPPIEDLEEEQFDNHFTVILLSKEEQTTVQKRILNISEIHSVDIDEYNFARKGKVEDASKEVRESESNTQQHKHTQSKTIRVNTDRIDHLMNLFEEMVIDRGRLEDISRKSVNKELVETVEHMSRLSKDMQNLMLTMRMVPVEQVFNRFPRMIRGLAKDLNKKINLEIIGADTELDRTVIDEIGDPLVHLIRNSVDHGIELPEERIKKGKPEVGQLILRAYHSGNHVFIEIEDDGAGINRDKVLEKAIQKGLVSEEHAERFTDEEVFSLIFASGFSTADKISNISGRGVGLDVVKNTIESLGGELSTQSIPNEGSRFTIQLPLTLSILSTLLIKVSQETYAIPLSSIVETVSISKENIMYVKGQPVMDFRGKVVPLLSLKEVFQVPTNPENINEEEVSIVIVKRGEKLTGLTVDSFVGQKEVVLKSLGNYFKDIYAVSGATILGDGTISLIIDTNALIK